MKHLFILFTLFFTRVVAAQNLETDRLALLDLYNSTDGDHWINNSGWNKNGVPGESPCGWFGVYCSGSRVNEIYLVNNNLTGAIPESITGMTGLRLLNFTNNHLSGAIPSNIGNLSNLIGISFAINELTGSIPASIGNLSNLTNLTLHSNQISGAIPTSIGNLTKIDALSISYNKLTGSIPAEIGNLIQLRQIGLNDNELSGIIPSQLGNLTLLRELILSRNRLTGSIPTELGNLTSLIQLVLGNNELSGTIPTTIKNLISLSFLGLGWNNLSGTIPDLSPIPNSCFIGISNNRFTFEGMESNMNKLDYYVEQAKIPITRSGAKLSVDAGGTISKNTYQWFKDGGWIATVFADNTFTMPGTGTYRVQVSNSVATALTLISEDYILSNALPVTLVNFSAKKSDGANLLQWFTTVETGNAGFDIERSPDAKSFQKIGYREGRGDVRSLQSYQFTDENPSQVSYYRLKQIDQDNSFSYSRIIKLSRESQSFKVYPNPVKDFLTIESTEKGHSVTIYNLRGARIVEKPFANAETVPTFGWLPGTYVVKLGDHSQMIVVSE